MNTKYWLIYALVVSCSISAASTGSPGSQRQARRILDSCEVKGGLVVHIGCGGGDLTAALRVNDSYVVQGLDADAANVEKARTSIMSKGLYGKVTVRRFDGRNLPYIDNLVNLLVVTLKHDVSETEMLRVLAPGGVAYVNKKKIVKPWPAGMDEWTHFHHNPQGTMVGKDQLVGPPRRIQWIGEPKWLRNHDFMSSMHAMLRHRRGSSQPYILTCQVDPDRTRRIQWDHPLEETAGGLVSQQLAAKERLSEETCCRR
ncbi:MAG: class I SAM-dependent methyltransferase [Planctomycetota bacterium]|jgi:SAM-dependent methyltransferase